MNAKNKDFDTLFNDVLQENLYKLELIRSLGISKFRLLIYLGLLFVLFMIFSILYFPEPFLLYVLISLIFTFFLLAERKAKDLRKKLTPKFKKKVILPILQYLYDDVHYEPRQKMSSSLLKNSLLLSEIAQKTEGDDFVRCKIGNTMIQFSDIEAYHRNLGMLFGGIFISASFNKTFQTKTIIFPKKKGIIGRRKKLYLYDQMHNASIIKLEDPMFKKKFMVIGEDQVESRYILSTSLMQRIIAYSNKMKNQIAFSFVNNKMYIALSTKKNMFEPRLFALINDKQFITSSYDNFILLTDLIEDLDLNTRIWQ